MALFQFALGTAPYRNCNIGRSQTVELMEYVHALENTWLVKQSMKNCHYKQMTYPKPRPTAQPRSVTLNTAPALRWKRA